MTFAQYRAKKDPIEAIQFVGDVSTEIVQWFLVDVKDDSMATATMTVVGSGEVFGIALQHSRPPGLLKIGQGDWLIRFGPQNFGVMGDEEFQDNWEPLDG